MAYNKLIERLNRLKVETKSLACMGCGYEHNCSIHGCRIIREATQALEALQAERDAMLNMLRRCGSDCELCANDGTTKCNDERCH